MEIGFIGTGVMGGSMVNHLLEADYNVHVFNRTKEKAMPYVEKGATWQDTPADIARASDVVFTIVGYPSDVEQVYMNGDGVFEGLSEGKTIIDMTTSTPALAEEIAAKATELGVSSLDAPVSGGDIGAKEGTLTIMVGGNKDTFDDMKPIMEEFSNELRYFGPAGSGQHTKMANQIMVAGTMTGMIEMFTYAEEAGLELSEVIKTVNGGAAQNRSLGNYGTRIIAEDYTPGFFVKHFVKDLRIALDEAEKMGIKLHATEQAFDLYRRLEELGHGDDGTQALIKLWWDD